MGKSSCPHLSADLLIFCVLFGSKWDLYVAEMDIWRRAVNNRQFAKHALSEAAGWCLIGHLNKGGVAVRAPRSRVLFHPVPGAENVSVLELSC